MANNGIENLKPQSERTKEEQREIARQGGKASGEARAARRDLRKALEALLDKEFKGKDGTVLSGAEAIALKQMEKALKGDTKAFEVVRDTAGQQITQKVTQVNVDMEYQQSVDYINKLMQNGDV